MTATLIFFCGNSIARPSSEDINNATPAMAVR